MAYTFDFRIDKGDKNTGTVYLPNESAKKLPVIIYCHGLGSDRQLNPSTKALFDKVLSGAAIVTFDFYGGGETGGDFRQMTYTRWKNNLADILDWVYEQNWANKNKIGCFAFSSGTTAALRLAQEDNRLSFVISIATCISTNIGMGKGGPCKLLVDNLEGLLTGNTVEIFGVDYGIDYYIDTISNAPIYNMSKIKCPVYFLQGGSDNIYRRTDAKIGYELMQKNNLLSSYHEITNGNHELDNYPGECADKAINWLCEVGIL